VTTASELLAQLEAHDKDVRTELLAEVLSALLADQGASALKAWWLPVLTAIRDKHGLARPLRPIEELIAASSLGDPAVVRIRKSVDPLLVARVLSRVFGEIDLDAANAAEMAYVAEKRRAGRRTP
jgi:hypothetical protein